MSKGIRKLLILDGIGGVPLGRELSAAFQHHGIDAGHYDCLSATKRVLYHARSAIAKLSNRVNARRDFFCLPRLSNDTFQALLDNEKPSHILVIGFIYKFFDPDFVAHSASVTGIPIFLYDTDSCNLYGRRREFIFFIERELSIYQAIFSFSEVTTRFFRETRGLNAVWVPFGANPIRANADGPFLDVLFVGSCDLRRVFLLERIKSHVTIRGNRWKRNWPLISSDLRSRILDEPIWGTDLHELLSRTKIVLNITRTDFFGAETGVNLRVFEALASGAFLLSDHCDELARIFKIGEEIDTFRSGDELVEKINYYLSNPLARKAISERGFKNLTANHTWGARAKELASLMCSE